MQSYFPPKKSSPHFPHPPPAPEVPTDDPRTMWNLGLIDFLKEHRKVLVCGQALGSSHP